MDAVVLRIYVHHTRKRFGLMLFDWMLAQAKAMGIHGGSAFCATAGFGRHGVIHEQRFVELAADLPIVVEFIVTEQEADRILDLLRREKVHAFCTRTATEVLVID
jgi:PII-like signaling protein